MERRHIVRSGAHTDCPDSAVEDHGLDFDWMDKRTMELDHESLMEIASAQGLLSATQMNMIEFDTWNAVKTSIGKPDRMTFDLDPGNGDVHERLDRGNERWRHYSMSANALGTAMKILGLQTWKMTVL